MISLQNLAKMFLSGGFLYRKNIFRKRDATLTYTGFKLCKVFWDTPYWLVPRIIQQIIVLEVLMWQMTNLFKNGFEDYPFCGNQKRSGPFKITKEEFYRMIQK